MAVRARLGGVLLLVGLLAAGCMGGSDRSGEDASRAKTVAEAPPGSAKTPPASLDPFGPPPATPKGRLDKQLVADLEVVFSGLGTDPIRRRDVRRIGASGDPRAAWLLSDLLRFEARTELVNVLVRSFEQLTGARLTAQERAPDRAWKAVTDHLIAWELPAPPGYVGYKARLFTLVEPRWAPFFRDRKADIDWRLVSWGGVLIDDRPLGDPAPCQRGCIPALDDPAVTDGAGGSWYPDDAIVFGVVVNDQARAYPKNIMEVHELVNDTLGGRRIGMPYCTLCASAQAYFTDDVVGKRQLVFRTSGLLSRSNKVMYELRTKSVFDTFKGRAVSGPLRRASVTLEQVTVVTSTWGAWKAAHPDTTIVARDGGIGRQYPEDPLGGRDDHGPIFPVGDVDPRLHEQEQVVGVVARDGTPVAFPAAAARDALEAGKQVRLAGVRLELDGDGLRAVLDSGAEAVSHQAFWFAWSQFHPGTALWTPLAG
jgi:Protein of unknown function (DUF3179)